ncbi:MAG: protein-disulfide reductase DsbD family protein [Bdellovibrionaceae bacterium]|nr:protein-disulfide reductase DsbD family protein [Pseudobdellovibrionaceae bacterium]
MKPFLFIFLLLFPFSSFDETLNSQIQKQSKKNIFHIDLISPFEEIKKDSPFLVGVHIKLTPEWYTYWSFPGDFGQSPQIKFKNIKGAQIKALPFPRPERKSLLINKESSYSFIYENELLIPFEVFIEENYKKETLNLSLDINWGICKDICISKQNKLQLSLKLSKKFKRNLENQKIFDHWTNLFPKNNQDLKSQFTQKGNKQIIEFSFKKPYTCIDIFPKKALDFSTKKTHLLKQTEKSCYFEVQKSKSNLNTIYGLLVYSLGSKIQSSHFKSDKNKVLGLFWFILMAFLGGLLLNIMPCVLPVIFLKFYNNLELRNQSRKRILLLNGSYSIGVILSFLILAGFIFISKQLGESLGWGFHLQSPFFVSFLAVLFSLMAFYFLEIFSFSAPKLPRLFKDQKISSHFLTGVLSTTAASPCTVPFMASAVGFAFSRNYLEIFYIFFFLGLGLSFPYLVLSFFPQILKYVPSPGSWTRIFKKLLSLPLFLTSFWLIYVLYFQLNLKAFFLTLMLFPVLFFWIFIQNYNIKKYLKTIVNTITFILIILILLGQKYFNLNDSKKIQSKTFLISEWKMFDNNEILFDKKKDQNILIAIGAKWCLTCKINERIFNTKEFKNLIKKNNIKLYYGDWTNKTDTITYFLESYGRQGVPFYIFFRGENKAFIFPSLLLKDSFLKKLKELSI